MVPWQAAATGTQAEAVRLARDRAERDRVLVRVADIVVAVDSDWGVRTRLVSEARAAEREAVYARQAIFSAKPRDGVLGHRARLAHERAPLASGLTGGLPVQNRAALQPRMAMRSRRPPSGFRSSNQDRCSTRLSARPDIDRLVTCKIDHERAV